MTTEISNTDNIIDLRSVTDRVEELEAEIASEHDDSEINDVLDMKGELSTLASLLEELKGNGGDHDWRGDWYPGSMIHESYFVEAMKDLCEDIGDLPNGMPGYLVIDWDATADNLRVDYCACDFDGQTYWYR